ncbi:MAG: CotH kinase family protein, partial [Bacteroidia bacterium]
MRKYVSAIVILIITMCANNTHAQIVINEYSAANLSAYTDQYAKTEDWLELHNMGAGTVQLQGHYLSDDSLVPMKYKIPFSTFISAGGFVRIWLSGRPSYTSNQIHATFKLSQTKTNNQVLCFSDASGVIKDKIKVSKTQLGHSRGRVTNGASTWRIFTTPTINASNNTGANFTKYAEKPSFSLVPGIYTGTQTVTIVNNDTSSSVIRYTTTGYEPNSSSPIYTAPITITANTVLKAKCYSNNVNILPSFMEFSTYFIGINHTIPIVSISGSALDSLANGDNTLRPMGAIEYFTAAGVRTSKSYGEYNSHGQDSWANDQRSLDFVARDEMGYSKGLKEKLYAQTNRDDFQRIILRAAGDDNYPAAFNTANEGSAHMRDAFFQNLCKDGGLKLDVRTAAKCIVYLNGQYWGVYDLREKPDDHDYTNYNYNQDKYHLQYLLTWGSTWSEYGGTASTTAWNNLRNYIKVNNMANPIKYQYVLSQLDVTSLADYVISHSLSVSSDWLNYNTGWWRGTDTAGTHRKWGYILWDNDASFAFYINYTGIADTSASADVCNVEQLTNLSSDPEEHITILNRLLLNPSFKQYYVMRYNDLLNTTFSCDYMLNYLDSVKNVIDPEMAAHATRWYGTYSDWLNNYNRLRDFISRRCGTNPAMNMTGCYNLTGPYPVTFTANPDSVATLQVNSLTLNKLPWTANYYGGIDVKLIAAPKNPSLYAFSNYTS